jgi:hypothetical protein
MKKNGRPLIFKYADIEFHFDHRRDHRLFLIHSEGPDLEVQVDIHEPST